jgi:hypothetical protein
MNSPTNICNVRDFGAKGDGKKLDTTAINEAIDFCSTQGGGKVLLPPGRYLSGTIHLRSHVAFFLEAGAMLIGATNLDEYVQPAVPTILPEAKWGKWHRGLIVGENIEDISIAGQGVINGNKVFDPTGEEKMRGPHTIALVNCKRFMLRDVSIIDSANYAVFFQLTDDVDIGGVKISGGWDGVHFRGAPGHPCRNVKIIGCQFYTGDDSIAGRYWDNVLISDCIVNSSCNGIRLIGPAKGLIVNGCLFYGPGLEPHRTSKRNNMLSGIILQPGAWDKTEGVLDDVLLANNTMRQVASPVTIWSRGDNSIGSIHITGLNATEVYRSALSIEGWADAPIDQVVIRNANIEFAGGGKAEQAKQTVKGPGVDARLLPAWGVYARNVEKLTFEDVRLSLAKSDQRPVVLADNVQRLTLDNFRYPRVRGVEDSIVTNNVGHLILTDVSSRP